MMNKFGSILEEFLGYSNISVKDFAERVGTSPKNLIDILKGNVELSQNMIYNISFITDIPVSYIENVEQSFKMDKVIDTYLNVNNITIKDFINRFNYKDFSKYYNFTFTDIESKYDIAKDILKYLRITNPDNIYKEDNTIFYKSNNDKPELLALWLERCYRLSQEQEVSVYDKNNINNLVSYIKDCASKNTFDIDSLVKEFNKNGIYLVIENDLPGSKIRGAFKVLNDKPAIYLTKKHKRYADIYFALLHELAHCKSDFNRAKSGSIVSDMDCCEDEDYELRADNTALNWMVDEDEYFKLKNNINYIEDCSCPKSFAVYRLARDNKISYKSKLYQKYNIIIENLE